jgi:L-lactate dehydrogenase complex protein LldE
MDSCQAVTHCQILDQPRTLLKNVEGLTLLELNDQQQCCGFGGVFATNFAQLSTSMGEQKLQSIIELGADTIISNDYGCLMHLDGLIKKKGLPIKIMHLADVLASGW